MINDESKENSIDHDVNYDSDILLDIVLKHPNQSSHSLKKFHLLLQF